MPAHRLSALSLLLPAKKQEGKRERKGGNEKSNRFGHVIHNRFVTLQHV